ncbi:methyltransferase domain-containing protein [Bdellovibrionota bacterium FG-2]
MKVSSIRSEYVLQGRAEFDRLERQSSVKYFCPETELASLNFTRNSKILDAGCGSGIATRFLAKENPESKIFGVEIDPERLKQTRNASQGHENISYQTGNISKLDFPDDMFDGIICRYVLEHLLPCDMRSTVAEFLRCLAPGGKIYLIDIDGLFYNTYPTTPFVAEVLSKLEHSAPFDLRVGRKLPSLLADAGFSSITWKIQTIECKGRDLACERQLLKEKLESAMTFLESILGGKKPALRFRDEYLQSLDLPGLVLFYNKFLVAGTKAIEEGILHYDI